MLNGKPKWDVEQQRVTIFRFPGVPVDANAIWHSIVGAEPDDISHKPSAGTTRLEGMYLNQRLILQVDSSRIDVVLAPPISADPIADFQVIGAIDDVLPPFIEAIGKWVSQYSPVLRLALGIVLIERTEGRVASYRRLSEFLPTVSIDAENSSDFTYQINRPKWSKVLPNLKINRLSKWAAMRVVTANFSLPNEIAAGEQILHYPTLDLQAVRLELDINSTQERTDEIPQSLSLDLLKEMADSIQEISLKGDIQ